MGFAKRLSAPCVLLAVVAALLVSVASADMELIQSYRQADTVYTSFTYTISLNLPRNRQAVNVELTSSNITGGGLTVAGWADNSLRGEYAFTLELNSFIIMESFLRITNGIPADSVVAIASTQVRNRDQQTSPFDFSTMSFTNNLTLSLTSSVVTMTGLAANSPVVQAGGGSAALSSDSMFDFYTSVQIVGVQSIGGSYVLSIPGGSSLLSSIQINDNSVVSVSTGYSCGLQSGIVYLGKQLIVTDSSYFRVQEFELTACDTSQTDDTALTRVPPTILASAAGDIQVNSGSVMLLQDITSVGSTLLESTASATAMGMSVGVDSTLSIININTLRFCDTCSSGVPTSSDGTSLVYAGQWTIGGTATTDYAANNLNSATGLDATGHTSNGACGEVQCLRHNTVGLSSGAVCACSCPPEAYAPACFNKVDRAATLAICQDTNCASCPTSTAVCSGCRLGFAPVNGVCTRIPCQVPNCAICVESDENRCLECDIGYGLIGDVCQQCANSLCAKCDGNVNVCTQCMAGSSLVNGACVPTSDLCTVPNCVKCVDNDWVRCEVCQDGYGLTSLFTCAACEDPNCKQCNGNTGVCNECMNGYYLTQYGTCSAVPCSVPYCEYCDVNDPSRCTGCTDGYIVNNEDGQCVPVGTCLVPNCRECLTTSPNVCRVCNTGYAVDPSTGECVATSGNCNVANCQTCVPGNPNVCMTCNNGYTVTVAGRCATANCLVYYCSRCQTSNPRRCYVCNNGYGITTAYTCVRLRTTKVTIIHNVARGPASLLVAVAAVVVAAIVFVL